MGDDKQEELRVLQARIKQMEALKADVESTTEEKRMVAVKSKAEVLNFEKSHGMSFVGEPKDKNRSRSRSKSRGDALSEVESDHGEIPRASVATAISSRGHRGDQDRPDRSRSK